MCSPEFVSTVGRTHLRIRFLEPMFYLVLFCSRIFGLVCLNEEKKKKKAVRMLLDLIHGVHQFHSSVPVKNKEDVKACLTAVAPKETQPKVCYAELLETVSLLFHDSGLLNSDMLDMNLKEEFALEQKRRVIEALCPPPPTYGPLPKPEVEIDSSPYAGVYFNGSSDLPPPVFPEYPEPHVFGDDDYGK